MSLKQAASCVDAGVQRALCACAIQVVDSALIIAVGLQRRLLLLGPFLAARPYDPIKRTVCLIVSPERGQHMGARVDGMQVVGLIGRRVIGIYQGLGITAV
jgi:hypothetical protein